MEQMYRSIGYDRRWFYSKMKREQAKEMKWEQVFTIVQQVRQNHPGMGIRTIWEKMSPMGIGRDDFEFLAFTHGLGIERKKRYTPTTDSIRGKRFSNKIKGLKLTHVNQVWVSDITYYWLKDLFYYLTFIMDLFSRKVIAYVISKDRETEHTTLPALGYAIKTRLREAVAKKMIIHSDGGGQYYDKEFIKLARQYNIESSMSAHVYENPEIERFHRTIKSQYIDYYAPETYNELKKATVRACLNYNNKPHQALKKMTPNEFEIECEN